MDFRVKCKNGDYIRIFRETGSAANDRLGNMIFSFAIHTDITDIKKNKKIGFYYKGNNGLIEFPDEELLTVNNVFSKREKEILYHLAKGKLSKEIAEILFISKHTVDTHRRNMLGKAMLKNTPELIIYGMENGII
jgi:DNA-binding CsgD family transcriptional regulator